MKLFVIVICLALAACTKEDFNSKSIYGNESGLPANCRAYIQVAINEWRRGTYETETTMDAIERNCGEQGALWDYKPK
ncbi:kynureninase [Acinetobacter sp. ESBL14]|uniref:kynureninase n=1 Tax=Acinetobacter sp. ESBL14 TaxID=3077329 RepID=UPI002FC78013